MRLIDADKLRGHWLEKGQNEKIYDTNDFLDSIDEQAPTVDAEPVRHGKWIDTRGDLYPRCSVCGEMSIDATFTNKGNKGMYCSSCGAKMDLKE